MPILDQNSGSLHVLVAITLNVAKLSLVAVFEGIPRFSPSDALEIKDDLQSSAVVLRVEEENFMLQKLVAILHV